MTHGSTPVWAAFVILLSVFMLPPLLLGTMIRRRRRLRARRNAVAPPGDAPATAQGQAATQTQPSRTAPATPPKDPWWDVALGVLVIGVVFVRLGMGLVSACIPDYRMMPPSMPKLQSRLTEYVEIKGLKKSLATGALKGRAVVVDKDKASLHPLMRELPEAIKATAPDEVDLVIWIQTERVPDPDSRITAAAKPTPQDMAKNPPKPGVGIPVDSVAIPGYKAKWAITVIDLKKKEIKRTHSLVGPDIPPGKIDIKSPWLSGQQCLYVDDKMAKGAEVIFGGNGRVFIGGKPLAGIVAPTPWDEALKWIGQVVRP